MANTKMTKVEKFGKVLEMVTDPEMKAFIENEMEMVARKNAKKSASPRKATKTQLENQTNAEKLTQFFDNEAVSDHPYTTQEIGDVIGIENITSQKATAIMKLVENVEKTKIDGKVAYLSLVVEIDEDGNEV